MHSMRIKDKPSHSLDVRGAKALFENGIRRQREPSPAPTRMTSSSTTGKNAKGNISSFKEKFEQFTAPRKETALPLRKAVSLDNVSSDRGKSSKPASSSGGKAEKLWFQAKTKIYEQLNNGKEEAKKQSKSDLGIKKDNHTPAKQSLSSSNKTFKDNDSKLDTSAKEKIEVAPLADRISRFKSNIQSKDALGDNKKVSRAGSETSLVKNLQTSYSQNIHKSDDVNHLNTGSQAAHTPKKSMSASSSTTTTTTATEKVEQPRSQSITSQKLGISPEKTTHENKKNSSPTCNHQHLETGSTKHPETGSTKHPETGSSKHPKTGSTKQINDENTQTNKTNPHVANKLSGDVKKSEKFPNNGQKTYEINDHLTAKNFMEDLITAIDNDQHVPMKQLIQLFETMKEDNNEMRDKLEKLKQQLDKSEIEALNITLQTRLDETARKLSDSQAKIQELMAFREALQESEERCEELEELNQQYLQEMEYLKLEMNEMRDQFHDDEVHETIILQQRLDDMARSLRIIHYRLKKADARLQETEREKESLLEEIRLLQGGTFTDEEIKRMQALEGDLLSAKEVSVQLHNQLEKSEERREKLELEAAHLRDEINAAHLENDRLRNNIQHLREKMSDGADVSNHKSNSLSASKADLMRQGSSTDMDTLKSNLEAAIERENDLKEQLKFAEEEAKVLRKRLRDIEHENEALSKQLRKLTQIAHNKSAGSNTDSKMMTSDSIQAQVVELENKELRNNNDMLHSQIDNLKSQVKSLQQKLELMQHEQVDGPLSLSKNSVYYQTKFELMTKEIEQLRWQLKEQEKDYKKLKENSDRGVRREQLRRAITIDCDTVDTKKQLDIVQQEAGILREKLHHLKLDNDRLIKENEKFQTISLDKPSLEETNQLLTSKVNSLEKENTQLLAQLEQQKLDVSQQKILNEIESENTRLITELSYYRKENPDVASLVNKLQQSEEKILGYEDDINQLKEDMYRMEHDLQDDINSLTMKNSILRSLLEAINQHEGGGDSSMPSMTSHNTTNSNTLSTYSSGATGASSMDVVESEGLISRHINRLPQDIQKQFREKIESLEAQLKEERERARTAESLLQQVKLHLKSCVLSSPLVQMMQPKKAFKYPTPPPSLIIKPAACNSPSHTPSRSSKTSSESSTPEKMRIGQSLASQMYLGEFPVKSIKEPPADKSMDEELLLVSISQENDSQKSSQVNGKRKCQLSMVSASSLINGEDINQRQMMLGNRASRNREKTIPVIEVNGGTHQSIGKKNVTRAEPIKKQTEQSTNSNHYYNTNGINNNSCEHEQVHRSSLRKDFFDNYNALSKGYKIKKKVSFALPSIERDVSDLSISSHLSAASDCTVLEDDEYYDVQD